MFRLDYKIAVITGVGSGIGRAISVLFAQQGATVHIIELNEVNARQTIEAIKRNKGEISSHACNVSDQTDVLATFEKIGAINVLINCAGIANIGKADTTK